MVLSDIKLCINGRMAVDMSTWHDSLYWVAMLLSPLLQRRWWATHGPRAKWISPVAFANHYHCPSVPCLWLCKDGCKSMELIFKYLRALNHCPIALLLLLHFSYIIICVNLSNMPDDPATNSPLGVEVRISWYIEPSLSVLLTRFCLQLENNSNDSTYAGSCVLSSVSSSGHTWIPYIG